MTKDDPATVGDICRLEAKLDELLALMRPKVPMTPANLEELERILNSEDDTPIQIMPDGSVRAL